mgnify:CR=1 FL=1
MTILQCKLTVLSPLHIGGLETEVGNMEFFYDPRYLYHVGENKMAQALKEEGLVEDFLNFMSSGRSSLQEYLQRSPDVGKKSLKKRLESKKIAMSGSVNRRINSFRLFRRDPLTAEPYIPGSSIKGALRSDILFALMEKNALRVEDVARAVQGSKRRDRKRAGSIVNRLLESADLKHARQGPYRDWLRALKVSDAFCGDNEPTSIQEIKVASINRNGRGYHWGAREASIYVDCLRPGVTFNFTVEIDGWLLRAMEERKKLQFDLRNIFNHRNRLKHMHDLEQAFWDQAGVPFMVARQKKHIDDGANLRLGWGSGYLGTTVGVFFDNRIKLDIGRKFYNARYDRFPNSRKTIVLNDGPVDTLGWCKVEQL